MINAVNLHNDILSRIMQNFSFDFPQNMAARAAGVNDSTPETERVARGAEETRVNFGEVLAERLNGYVYLENDELLAIINAEIASFVGAESSDLLATLLRLGDSDNLANTLSLYSSMMNSFNRISFNPLAGNQLTGAQSGPLAAMMMPQDNLLPLLSGLSGAGLSASGLNMAGLPALLGAANPFDALNTYGSLLNLQRSNFEI